MNIETIHKALMACVKTYRKQEDAIRAYSVGGGLVGVMEINTDPHEAQCPSMLTKVDVHFFIAGVDKEAALWWRPQVIEALAEDAETLKKGPSYLTLGAVVGDQQAALMLMALGQVMGLWRVVTPAMLRVPLDMQERAAGNGYVLISGYRTGPFEEGNDDGREPQLDA